MAELYAEYEDRVRETKKGEEKKNQYSRYCDLIYYQSSINPELTLAMRISKPEKPSYILAGTHGWHMSIQRYEELEAPESEYLKVQVDMRGRAYSDGKPDCNGWELYDIIDAVEYVKEHYREYILDKDVVYFEAGSGGGGNAYTIAGKFPDYFAQVTALSGMSDYSLYYEDDKIGEFRDEMDVWIGDFQNKEAYKTRSGIALLDNLCVSLAIVHGEKDIRVPIYHARNYVAAAAKCGKDHLVSYLELAGVGGMDHYVNITENQTRQMLEFSESLRRKNRKPVQIPRNGRMKVGGFLFTKEFYVILNSIDKMAEVEYDMDKGMLSVTGVAEGEYRAGILNRNVIGGNW